MTVAFDSIEQTAPPPYHPYAEATAPFSMQTQGTLDDLKSEVSRFLTHQAGGTVASHKEVISTAKSLIQKVRKVEQGCWKDLQRKGSSTRLAIASFERSYKDTESLKEVFSLALAKKSPHTENEEAWFFFYQVLNKEGNLSEKLITWERDLSTLQYQETADKVKQFGVKTFRVITSPLRFLVKQLRD